MYTKWTQHLTDPEEKERFQSSVLGSKRVLERLSAILREDEEGLNKLELDVRSFDQPNWDYRQAYRNGYRASLNMLRKLIDLDQQEHK